MTILRKLKEHALTVSLKLNMNEVAESILKQEPSFIKKMLNENPDSLNMLLTNHKRTTINFFKNNPEMLNDEVISQSIRAGNVSYDLLKLNPITKDNVNEFLEALEETPKERYSSVLNKLLTYGIVQEATDLSKFLNIHLTKTHPLDSKTLAYPFISIGHMDGEFGEYIPEKKKFTKAVIDNIDLISYEVGKQIISRDLINNKEISFLGSLNSSTNVAKFSLIGLSFNANNLEFAKALQSEQKVFSKEDVIAGMDFLKRTKNKLTLAEYRMENQGANTEELEKKLNKDVYAKIDEDLNTSKTFNIQPETTEETLALANTKTLLIQGNFFVDRMKEKLTKQQKDDLETFLVQREQLHLENDVSNNIKINIKPRNKETNKEKLIPKY